MWIYLSTFHYKVWNGIFNFISTPGWQISQSENVKKSDLKNSRICLICSQSDHIGIQSEIPDNKAGQGYHIGPTFDQIVSKWGRDGSAKCTEI